MSIEVGQLIENKYRIVKLIGEGGMGAVYEGENVRINRRVAIKVLHAAFTGNTEVMQRFEREAQAAGRIGNDHILEVLDLGQLNDGDHFIVMEYLDGAPLSEWIKRGGRLMPHDVAPILQQALVGLGAAHAAGIIHRDLKPDNIFILKEKAGKKDFVKIIDFGISKFQPLSGDGMKMTRTGAVMGTPYYMSPEQASGSHDADHRSDIYALGVILYEAVTGRVPFDAATFNQLMFKIVLSDVPPPESIVPDLDPAFSSIIAKAMARDVNQRFQSTREFAQALTEWQQSGRAVTVPPAADAGAAGLLPTSGLRPSQVGVDAALGRTPGTAGATGTGGTWATSQPDGVPGVPKRAGPVPLLLGVGLLVVGGGAFGAYSIFSDKPEATQAAPPELASSAAAAPEPAPPPAPTPAVSAAPEPSVAPVASVPAPAPTPAPVAAAAPAPKPVARPRPAPAKPAPKPTLKKPPSAAPDFGY